MPSNNSIAESLGCPVIGIEDVAGGRAALANSRLGRGLGAEENVCISAIYLPVEDVQPFTIGDRVIDITALHRREVGRGSGRVGQFCD